MTRWNFEEDEESFLNLGLSIRWDGRALHTAMRLQLKLGYVHITDTQGSHASWKPLKTPEFLGSFFKALKVLEILSHSFWFLKVLEF